VYQLTYLATLHLFAKHIKQERVIYLDNLLLLTGNMATAASVTTSLATCPICLDICDNPKSLPCLHAFCLKCLQELYIDKSPGARVSCPKCRKEFQIPPNGVDGFPHHFMVQQLVEMINQRGTSCDMHKDEEVKLYCRDCDENICLICSAVRHKYHDSAEISEVVEDFRSRINDYDDQIQSAIGAVRGESEQTLQATFEFLSIAEEVKNVVHTTGEAIKRSVDDQINEVLGKLQTVMSDSTNRADSAQDGHGLRLVKLESFHTYSRELLDKGRPSDITQAACELHDRATKLLGNDVTAVKYRPPHVTFTPVDVTQVKRLNLIGKLNVRTEDQPGNTYLMHSYYESFSICPMMH